MLSQIASAAAWPWLGKMEECRGHTCSFQSQDAANSLLILIQEPRGQKFLLKELHTELGGFVLKILILFRVAWKLKRATLVEMERRVTIP